MMLNPARLDKAPQLLYDNGHRQRLLGSLLSKQAAVKTELLPHQEEAVRRALENNIVLAHALGSGKTLSAIAAADAIGKPITVLTPASLVENFKKELAKHKKGGPPVEVISLPTAVKHNYEVPEGNTLILDEAHSARNPGTKRRSYLQDQVARAGRSIFLTGTPGYNNIADIARLVNLAAKKTIVPGEDTLFNRRYIIPEDERGSLLRFFRRYKTLRNAEELKERLSPYLHIHSGEDPTKPARNDEDIEVLMSPEQLKAYKLVMNKLPYSVRRAVKRNLPPSKRDTVYLNAFLAGSRQVSNTPKSYDMTYEDISPKIQTAAEELRARLKANPKLRAIVYSNYLDSGINSYADLLDSWKIPYKRFTGELTSKKKKEIVDAYNSGRVPVLLGSGAASEGLDLKNTRLIQILEPHFNKNRIEQVIGRGIRHKSHDSLSPEDRNVLVQHYYSLVPLADRLSLGLGVDSYLKAMADRKQESIDELMSLLGDEAQPTRE